MLCGCAPCYECLEEPAASDFMVEDLSLLVKIGNSGNFDRTCPPFLPDFIGSVITLVPIRRISLPWQVSLNIGNTFHIHMAPLSKIMTMMMMMMMMMIKPPWKPSYYPWIFVINAHFYCFCSSYAWLVKHLMNTVKMFVELLWTYELKETK